MAGLHLVASTAPMSVWNWILRGILPTRLPKRAHIDHGCAFEHRSSGFDACIGNPPYVRHHDIESPWKENIAGRLGNALEIDFRLDGNLYLYFLALALQKAKSNGLVGLVLPYEWTSRPSATSVRKAIQQNNWHVNVYRFKFPIFDRVLTTASITFIDKARSDNQWQYFDVGCDFQARTREESHSESTGPTTLLCEICRLGTQRNQPGNAEGVRPN